MRYSLIKVLPFIVMSLLLNPVSGFAVDKKPSAPIVKTAYLTFDDGPSALTGEILTILKEKEVPATFFVCGKNVKDDDTLLERMIEEGHAIGNHSYSHDYLNIYKNVDAFFQDFYKNEEKIVQKTGIRPKILRFPGGTNNQSSKLYGEKYIMNSISERLEKNGYVYFDWNVSSRDANGVDYTVEEIISMTLAQTKLKKDAIILFHDAASKKKTVKALPAIIEGLVNQGYQFNILTEDSFRVAFPLPKVKKEIKKAPVLTKYQLWKLKQVEAHHKE